ncbi:MAG: GspMb/PilO family protein [Prosthecobacter sp.]
MTANEQRLALGLGVVLIGGMAFIGLTKLKSWKQRVDTQAMAMETRRAEADELLAKQDFWNQRSSWLSEKQPLFTKAGEASTNVLNLVDELASKHSVKITQKQLTEAIERAGMTSANVTLEARGEMKPVLAWLYDLQQPTGFITIPAMTITPNEEDTKEIIVNMNVQKWFRLPPS